MKKLFIFLAALAGATIIFAGCGETIHGVGKDVERQTKSVKTFFFRQ